MSSLFVYRPLQVGDRVSVSGHTATIVGGGPATWLVRRRDNQAEARIPAEHLIRLNLI